MNVRRKIFYTGLRKPDGTVRQAARRAGIRLLHTPTVQLRYRRPRWRGRGELADVLRDCLVLVGGPAAAAGFTRWVRKVRSVEPGSLEVWVVGPRAASEVGSLGCRTRTLDDPTASSIARLVEEHGAGRVLVAAGSDGRDDLRRALERRGVSVSEIEVYDFGLRDSRRARRAFRGVSGEDVVFSSPRGVDGFLVTIRQDSLAGFESRFVALTDETARAIKAADGVVGLDAAGRATGIVLQALIDGIP